MKKPIVELVDVCKVFKNPSPMPLFNNVNISVEPGATVAITGASGVGKSTLLHIIALLDDPTSGAVNYLLQSSTKEQMRNQAIGFIFQNFYLMEEESAIDNILLPAKIGRQPTHKSTENYQHALSLLEEVNMSHRAHHPVKLLSGGEKQRIAIARAFCNNPPLIIADEPTGNLDESHSEMVQELLLSCCEKRSKALILATHDQNFANLCQDHYTLLDKTLVEK